MTFDPKQTQLVRSPRAELRSAEHSFRTTSQRPGLIERACDRIDGQRGRVAIPKIIAIALILWLSVLGASAALHWVSDLINNTAANMQPKDVHP